MLQRFCALFLLVLLTTCDDGDIINITLEFDQELQRCDNFENFYLIYDTREDPNEALILTLPKPEYDYLFDELAEDAVTTLSISSATGIRFNYRTYNSVITEGALCNELSDPNLILDNDYETNTGEVIVDVIIVDDDNDGIPSFEEDINGNGNLDDDDTDLDGIANYLDRDDDNDNVLTIEELDEENADGDDDPLTNPLDTDNDGTPNYLDNDDDGDDILTRLEDIDEEKNPRGINNLVPDENGVDVYRYLYNHPTAMEAFADVGFNDNEYTRSITTNFTLINIGLEIIDATVIELGSFASPNQTFTTVIED
ncbi:hypothetical protein [Winogradskyella tangerina]|uniref:hypothetical protein n=1 Tax=Winogradskyella tangerina TaxID=2023240 RepID=UPI000DBE5155|nr:hypothetical protein [Winogradskyella tangerina]